MKLFDDGVTDTEKHKAIMEVASPLVTNESLSQAERQDAIDKAEKRRKVVESLVRSDFERLAQWELIWSKLIFQITGQVLDFSALVDVSGNQLSEEELRKVLGLGLKLTTMESGVKALQNCQRNIEDLKEKIGLRKKTGTEQIGTGQSLGGTTSRPEMTLEDLRNFREILENTPPEKRSSLAKMLRSEDNAIQILSPAG